MFYQSMMDFIRPEPIFQSYFKFFYNFYGRFYGIIKLSTGIVHETDNDFCFGYVDVGAVNGFV